MTNTRLIILNEDGMDVPCINLTDETGAEFDVDLEAYVVLSALRIENRQAYDRLVAFAGLLVEQADWTGIKA